MSSKQGQTATDGATAIQAGGDVIVQNGMTYLEVRQVALDVFRANFYELAGVAGQVASARAEEITESFLGKLQEENPEGFGKANDPGFQHALYTVQKEHARTGDKDLADLLVDLLVDRTKFPQRDIMQIVLDECLSTAPKLTEEQLASLSMVFLFKFTLNNGMGNHVALGEYFDRFARPFSSKLSRKDSSFRHLEFAGCGAVSLAQATIENCLLGSYRGLFSKGFDLKELEGRGISINAFPNFFTRCLNDAEKIQVNALNQQQLDARLQVIVASEDEKSKIRSLFDFNPMNEGEIRTKCIEIRPYMMDLFEAWSSSRASAFTLISVGIAIAHANIKRIAGEFADLSIWIN